MNEQEALWDLTKTSIELNLDVLEQCGIRPNFDIPSFDSELQPFKDLQEWSRILRQHCTRWREIRGWVKEEVWANYDLMGVTGLREQDMLADAREVIRAHWKKRPQLLRKKREERPNVGTVEQAAPSPSSPE
jgi:hypothetical protein